MTCQTIVRHFLLGMAVHTPAHGHLDERCCRRFFALANGSVTGLTFHLPKNDMASVGVEDVIGHFVELPPRDFLLFFCKLPDLLFFRTLGDRVFVTLQTDRGVRHSGKGLGLIVSMARVAPESLFDMLLVVKSDRLIRF